FGRTPYSVLLFAGLVVIDRPVNGKRRPVVDLLVVLVNNPLKTSVQLRPVFAILVRYLNTVILVPDEQRVVNAGDNHRMVIGRIFVPVSKNYVTSLDCERIQGSFGHRI